MTDNSSVDANFVITKEHRRFIEFCHACLRYRYIGLCYGSPGVGKTLSAYQYTRWHHIHRRFSIDEPSRPELPPEIMECHSVFYAAPVNNSPRLIAVDLQAARFSLNTAVTHARKVHGQYPDSNSDPAEWEKVSTDATELIIVDEADRLKTSSLEQLREIYDRGSLGVILIGMPGIEKRLSRYPQLYSRVGFVHHFKPLSPEEVRFILEHKSEQLGIKLDLTDFTDAEAVAAIVRITTGNFRLIQRLFNQIERIMEINDVHTLTKEVVEAARESLIIGTA